MAHRENLAVETQLILQNGMPRLVLGKDNALRRSNTPHAIYGLHWLLGRRLCCDRAGNIPARQLRVFLT